MGQGSTTRGTLGAQERAGQRAGDPGAFMGKMLENKPRQLLGQLEEMLGSTIPGERADARRILMGLVLKGAASARAKELLVNACERALGSEDSEERMHGRSLLRMLFMRKDIKEARAMLERELPKAVADMDFDALVFLGMNAREAVGKQVDAALEANFTAVARAISLEALEYIAAMSNCSIEIRRRSAAIVADCEKRRGNLGYVHDASEDPEIKSMMAEALRRRAR